MCCDSLKYYRGCLVGILVFVTMTANADTVMKSIKERTSWLNATLSTLYDNPAVKPLQYVGSLTSLNIGFENSSEWTGSVKAEVYRHIGASTAWGEASYSVGKQDDHGLMSLSVTPDITANPYFPATGSGGPFFAERYSFSGGYGLTSGKWSYGGSLSYDAYLSYRREDPRPKNVSGTLAITIGIARNLFHNVYLATHLRYVRYTQSSSMMFVSQQGADPIYHLTGLGSRYPRFDGQGWKTYYSGNFFQLGLSVYQQEQGWMTDVHLRRKRLSTVLSDLNNLPLANLTQYDMDVQSGYKSENWFVGLRGEITGAEGIEGIFGDPEASVYPVIATQKSYSLEKVVVGGNVVRCIDPFTVRGEILYNCLLEKHHIDSRLMSLHTMMTDVGIQWKRSVGKCLVNAEISGIYVVPFRGVLQLPLIEANTDFVGSRLNQEVQSEFDCANHPHLYGRLSAFVAFPIKQVALCTGASFDWTRYKSFNLNVSICF